MNNKMKCVAAALLVATTACSSNDTLVDTGNNNLNNRDNERKYVELTTDEQTLVSNSNDFAFNLFRAAADGKSQILSPISITYALGMLNNGAAGTTQQQINQVLGFTDAQAVNDFCRKMLTEAPTLDKLTKVLIANTIYMNKDYQLLPDFKQKAKDYYEAEPETRDFADGQTMDVINRWASDHTEQMIQRVLNEQSFDKEAVSYLLNAIYFKGDWAQKFNKNNTRDEQFEGAGKVPMMHQEHEFNYAECDDYQALRMPYGNGAYQMTILLPRQGKSVSDVLAGLNGKSWQNLRYMGEALVDVKLPRFESQTDITLNDIMCRLGMPTAFDPDFAEFPNFCDTSTYIGMMKQVARIKLNEEGTEAAAVTVIGMYETTAVDNEPRRVEFHANRPFLYVISEQSTGAVFFIGTYTGK